MAPARLSSSDPTLWAAGEIAAAVSARVISIPEVVESYLTRMRETEHFNALAWHDPDVVRAQAQAAQARLDKGESPGRLVGVPFTVKDVIATDGVPTRAGSRVLADNVPRKDAAAVANVKRNGAVMLAKGTCPEFALSTTTASELHGRTRSPWGADLSPGGSSGGDAVLVSCGASALGIGTDFGGSLRWPAQCAGVVSLRPTVGRVPATGQLPGAGGAVGESDVHPNPATLQGRLQVIGPLARTVDDLRIAVSALGSDAGQAVSGPISDADVSSEQLAGAAFGWSADDTEIPCSDDVRDAMQAVVAALCDAGLKSQYIPDLLAGGCKSYKRLREADPLAEIRLVARGAESMLTPEVQRLLERPAAVDSLELSLAWQAALDWRARFLERLRDFVALIVPVAPGDATGHEGVLVIDGRVLGPWQLMAYCRAVSLTGLPVVSIPCANSSRGLPLSVQVIGRSFGEADVLLVAGLIERALGGARLPPRSSDSGRPPPL